jgi:hypothetical protein
MYGCSGEVLKERRFSYPPLWIAEKYIKTGYQILVNFQGKKVLFTNCA